MTDVVVTTGAVRRAKLQSNRHRQQINAQRFTGRICHSCRATNSVEALKREFELCKLEPKVILEALFSQYSSSSTTCAV